MKTSPEDARRLVEPARWRALETCKVAGFARMTPDERVQAGWALQRHAMACVQGWPTATAGDEDLANHLRMCELLRIASPVVAG